jgi:hypothetical protein
LSIQTKLRVLFLVICTCMPFAAHQIQMPNGWCSVFIKGRLLYIFVSFIIVLIFLIRRVSIVEQELLTLPDHPSSHSAFVGFVLLNFLFSAILLYVLLQYIKHLYVIIYISTNTGFSYSERLMPHVFKWRV